jgi:DNA repair exonuclease SbcCD nuclease subunit
MATVKIYSDPHLGLKRKQNFTARSAAARDNEAIASLHNFVSEDSSRKLCLGDFFDTTHNDEQTLLKALPIAAQTSYVQTGNHDIPNRAGAASSLLLLSEVVDTVPAYDPAEPCIDAVTYGRTKFTFLPHVLSQELFEKQLDRAVEAATEGTYHVLCLHCNYAFGREMGDATLNLSRERAAKLLEKYHYIFLGHEHTHRTDFDGRLVVIGSWRPTAFDNMDDKYVLLFDDEAGTYEKQRVWSAQEQYAELDASDVVLTANPRQYYLLHANKELAAAVKTATDLFERGAFGVKIVTKQVTDFEIETVEYGDLQTLPRRISDDLKENRPHLLPYWENLKDERA